MARRKRATADLVQAGERDFAGALGGQRRHCFSTKLSMTFFSPALSKSTVSLLPSTPDDAVAELEVEDPVAAGVVAGGRGVGGGDQPAVALDHLLPARMAAR
jgi:hypothetical protein